MTKAVLSLIMIAATAVAGFAQGHNNPCDKRGKVLVCHLPPGNPENVQEICISESAVAAHLAHGCYVGTCDLGGQIRPSGSYQNAAIADFVTVYPNPFTDQFTIEMVFEDDTQTEIAIYDMKGTLIDRPFSGLSESSFILDYNTEKLSAGLYFVRVTTPTKARVFKMAKN